MIAASSFKGSNLKAQDNLRADKQMHILFVFSQHDLYATKGVVKVCDKRLDASLTRSMIKKKHIVIHVLEYG